MEVEKYLVLRNSASKRALFRTDGDDKGGCESDNDSLGPMSPLQGSSPDRYSSPPPSPCWFEITPVKSGWNNTARKPKDSSPIQNLTQNCTESPIQTGSDINVVNETPEKLYTSDGLMTPFRGLSKKSADVVEETPDSVVSKGENLFPMKKRGNTESSHWSLNKAKKLRLDFNCPAASLIQNSFYKPAQSKVRASLFPEKGDEGRRFSRPELKRSLHFNASVPYSVVRRFNRRRRNTMGEINCGVRHNIKKPKQKKRHTIDIPKRKSLETPKVLPKDRVAQFMVENSLLVSPPKESPNRRQCLKDGTYNVLMSSERSNKNIDTGAQSPTCAPDAEPEFESDPNKKFFKTNRTLVHNRKATVTVIDNVKIQVHNGKLTLNDSAKKVKPQKKVSETTANEFDDISQEPVETTMQLVLRQLDDDLAEKPVFSSPELSCITTSTSSLVLEDVNAMNDTNSADCGENINPKVHEKKDEENSLGSEKLYPLFYRQKGLSDVTNTTPKKSLSAKKIRPIGNDQYQIDAGQNRFRAVQCKECGIVYHLGDPDDELAHYNLHNNVHSLKILKWKNERVVKNYINGRVIVVYPDDPKPWLNKVKIVLDAVDQDLGFAQGFEGNLTNSKAYMYVMKQRVVGVLVAHPQSEAYKMLLSSKDGVDCCSEEAYPVRCGVSRIWTAPGERRKRIASSLMDCLRCSFMFDKFLAPLEIAFSVPTEEGKAFAEKYMGTPEYMVFYH